MRSRSVSVRVLTLSFPFLALASPFAGVAAPTFDHLQCFKAADTQSFRAAVVHLTTMAAAFQLPSSCEVKGKTVQVCVPAAKALIDPGTAPVPPRQPPAQDLQSNDYLCYKVKCPDIDVAPVAFTDQFGFRATRLKSVARLCVPAVQGIVTTTTTTTLVTTTTILEPEVDHDGDGWSANDGDCCETAACTPNPEFVNPGAFEMVGNGMDDDCDASTSDDTPAAACSFGQDVTGVTANDIAAAMDLCQTTTPNAALAQRKWGLLSASFLLSDGSAPTSSQLANMQNYQAAALTGYGTAIVPTANVTMAGLSSGRMRDENDPGYVVPASGTDFSVTSTPPAAYLTAHGGTLPSQGCEETCATGNNSRDPIDTRLRIRVPTNAVSVSFDFRFFNADYQTYYCTAYNDFFLALLTSEAAGLPADGNIALHGGNPVSLNNTRFDLCANSKPCVSCAGGTAELAGTGMDDVLGAGTIWTTATAPVVPGEEITLDLMVFDVTDGSGDSVVLIDNLRWGLAGGVP
ncbi:MAG TPA: choice-of-anchor L domain-containing protein [Candidatus Limnocylindrales bacterium]|nr:choice-of-anchor L domain-containing protein [Candidatus Limnocylindrales bacterium]